MIYGTFEAKLAELLEPFENLLPENMSLAYLPTSGIIKLRLTARGGDRDLLNDQLDKHIALLNETVPEFIYGYDGELLEESIGRMLRESKTTLSIAESCTGGNITRMITSVAGSSEYLIGSVVAYHNRIKSDILDVDPGIIEKNGAVSREVVVEMAKGIRKRYNTDYAVATTGIAGPGGGTAEKPVGTVWIAVSSENATIPMKFTFGNVREHNIRRSSLAALNMLRVMILKETSVW